MIAFARIVLLLLADLVGLVRLAIRPRQAIAAENLVLRRQLALYKERGLKPRRLDAATRVSLAWWSRWCDWRSCLVVVRPETVIRWHRAGWRLLWRYKSRPGRPRIPLEVRQLIHRIATENPLWGEERIANELRLKLGIRVSPRTVRKYMPRRPPGQPRGDQRWATFLRNHAKAMIACDFFVAVTMRFQLLYVFVLIHHGSRRLVHVNVTADPTAAWTLQQLREAIGLEQDYRYLLQDRDRIFARHLDESIESFGRGVLKSPPQSPVANAFCERLIGTIRRECVDWLVPISESHLRLLLAEWSSHYNRSRPHMSLGPGVPDPPSGSAVLQYQESRHRIRRASLWSRNRCWAGCTVNTHSRPPPPHRLFAEHRGCDTPG
ncbi:MAG: integrase core domain-containing protein, partial [Burkholderiales bacterium]